MLNDQFLEVTIGLPGSGKSTYATTRSAADPTHIVVVNRDQIRAENGFYKFSKANEKRARNIRDERIVAALNHGMSVINDDTNIAKSNIEHFKQMAAEFGVEFIVNDSFMEVPVMECIKRDLGRARSVGKDVIERMYYQYWEQQPKPINAGPYPAIMCDIDGTLALIPQGSNPYDRDFSKDILNAGVSCLLRNMRDLEVDGHFVILQSGRDEKFREVTINWLRANDVYYDELFMRAEGDTRKDYVVKKEIYMNHIQGKYDVDFVLDDRPSVCRMWRAELGLTVLEVGNHVEF